MFAVTATSLARVPEISVHIDVNTGRALGEAVFQLEKQAGMAIDYEDIPYAYSGDTVDNTDIVNATRTPEQKAANPNVRFLVPRYGQFSLDTSIAGSVAGVTQLVNTLIGEHASQGLPGVYSASFSNGALFLTPTQMRDASGTWTAITPILDTPITIPNQKRTVAAAMDAILQQVSKANGTKIGVGMTPLMLMLASSVTIGASNEPARSVIARMFSMLPPGKLPDGTEVSLLGYHLNFDPKLRCYGMNVNLLHTAQQPTPLPARTKPAPGAPNPYGTVKSQ